LCLARSAEDDPAPRGDPAGIAAFADARGIASVARDKLVRVVNSGNKNVALEPDWNPTGSMMRR